MSFRMEYGKQSVRQFPASSKENEDYYFLHSYSVYHELFDSVLTTTYCNFISSFHQDNLFGVQFHPEKSGQAGLMLLKQFTTF